MDHVAIEVSDFGAGRALYEAALAPLGIEPRWELGETTVGFGDARAETPRFLVNGRGNAPTTGAHLAFAAPDRDAVDAFHAAAVAAGATDNGAPGPRPYHAHYYAAFVLDHHGNNVEAVCHRPPQ